MTPNTPCLNYSLKLMSHHLYDLNTKRELGLDCGVDMDCWYVHRQPATEDTHPPWLSKQMLSATTSPRNKQTCIHQQRQSVTKLLQH